MKKFLFVLTTIITIITIFSLTAFAWTPEEFAQAMRNYMQTFAYNVYHFGTEAENENVQNSEPNVNNFDSGSLYFNIFDVYRNQMNFVYAKGTAAQAQANKFTDFVDTQYNDNLVMLQENNVTLVTNRVYDANGNFDFSKTLNNFAGIAQDIHMVSCSTPTNKLKPTVYFSEKYTKFDVYFSINVTMEIVMMPDAQFISTAESLNYYPNFCFYLGNTSYDYKIYYPEVTTNYIKLFNSKALSIDYTIRAHFDEPCTLLGFWTGVTFPNYLFTNGNDGPGASTNAFFVNTYQLSPVNFFSPEYGVQIGEDISEIDSSAYEFYMLADKPSIAESFTGNVYGGLAFLSNGVNLMYRNIPIIRYSINFALACGIISIILGVTVNVASRVSRVSTSASKFKYSSKNSSKNNSKNSSKNRKKGG